MQVELIHSVSRGVNIERLDSRHMRKQKFPPNNLKAIRMDRGLSRPQLADMVKPQTSQDTIRKIEECERGLSDPWKIRFARALQCQPSDFISSATYATDDEFASLAKKRGFDENRREDLIKFIHFLETKKD
jgi:hypothetical protein